MDLNNIVYRHEKKFVDNSNLESLDILQTIIPSGISEIYSERRINSIYYDTDSLYLANLNIDGIGYRDKFRIRYYGSKTDLEKPKLEIKSKRGLVGHKINIDINIESLFKNQFNLSFLAIDSNIPNNLTNLLYIIKPLIIVSYNRRYYLSNCSAYRVTFDKDIEYNLFNYDLQNRKIPLIGSIPDSNRIIEIKYNAKDSNDASLISQNFPYRLTSCSKYINGLTCLGLI
ncbi:VTC domain-containing protein [Prochlorococcus marinus]|uniref:VTC domain-containing protein n=1 Tax=Prochlorococcus marinus TaxID=1219 RepID=UPI0022B4D6F6|nr:VTC domain-containing protein [Prochlorococcus marinus]